MKWDDANIHFWAQALRPYGITELWNYGYLNALYITSECTHTMFIPPKIFILNPFD